MSGDSLHGNGKIAVLGAGKLGEALIRGMLSADLLAPSDIHATCRRHKRAEYLARELEVNALLDNREAAAAADIIVVALKPQGVHVALDDLADIITPGKLVISVAASVTTASIEGRLGEGVPVIRAMPNTPSLIRCGMTVLAPGRHASESHLETARHIFLSVGRCLVLEDKHMDAVTGLSASGPAFIYIIIESLAEAGVKVGLPRDVATELAAQTVLGSASMVLATRSHPALLKDTVTTPAGCTIDGILELEEGGLRVTLIKAVVRATERARQLAPPS